MELEEAIKDVKEMIKKSRDLYEEDFCKLIGIHQMQSIATVLKAVENSIPKEVVKNYLKEEQEKINVYKKEAGKNENLKLQLWNHMGRKNMCERILEIETIVTLKEE